MSDKIYRKLAAHLDKLPGGFPATESGVEQRILRRLFTPEEAELATHLTLIPEAASVVARRAGIPKDEAVTRLEEMSQKGQIFSMTPRSGETLYMASQFVIGIWEHNVNNLDEGLIKDMREYIPTLFDMKVWKELPQLRTIPVGKSISTEQPIMHYEEAEKLIRQQKRLLVAPCICRREHRLLGEGCGKPEETCLVFGVGADYYAKNGLGRYIEVDEALEILRRAEKAGLVLQPSNAQKVVNICCCCGCCCQVLKTIKEYPRPAELVSSPFVAKADPEKCTACGVCLDRCQMEAVSLVDDHVVLDLDRCIGCGLCVTTCPGKALTLERKPEDQQQPVPKNVMDYSIQLGKARGKLSNSRMAMMSVKSKVDRLLATK